MTAPSAPTGARRRACAAGITRLSSTSHRNWKVFAAQSPAVVTIPYAPKADKQPHN